MPALIADESARERIDPSRRTPARFDIRLDAAAARPDSANARPKCPAPRTRCAAAAAPVDATRRRRERTDRKLTSDSGDVIILCYPRLFSHFTHFSRPSSRRHTMKFNRSLGLTLVAAALVTVYGCGKEEPKKAAAAPGGARRPRHSGSHGQDRPRRTRRPGRRRTWARTTRTAPAWPSTTPTARTSSSTARRSSSNWSPKTTRPIRSRAPPSRRSWSTPRSPAWSVT